MFGLLVFALGADPTFEVRNLCPPVPTFTVTNRIPLGDGTVSPPRRAGEHSHRCANGHVWHHGHDSFGKVADHTCPVCGLQDWTPRPATEFTFRLPVSPSSCPGGMCPTPAAPTLLRWRR